MTIYSPDINNNLDNTSNIINNNNNTTSSATPHIKFEKMNTHAYDNNNNSEPGVFSSFTQNNHVQTERNNTSELGASIEQVNNLFPYNNEHPRSLSQFDTNNDSNHVYSYYNENDGYEFKDYEHYNDYEEDALSYSNSVAPSSITPQQIIYASELNNQTDGTNYLSSKRSSVSSIGRKKKNSIDCFDSIDTYSSNNQDLIMTREEAELLTRLNAKERRQLRNKISARNFRIRRKEYISSLESKVEQQECETKRLREELKDKGLEILKLKNEILKLTKSKSNNINYHDNNSELHNIKYRENELLESHNSLFVNNNDNDYSYENNPNTTLDNKKNYGYNSQEEQ